MPKVLVKPSRSCGFGSCRNLGNRNEADSHKLAAVSTVPFVRGNLGNMPFNAGKQFLDEP